jgi:acetyltransferase
LRRLVQVGRDEKLERIVASILPENRDMQHVCKRVGFHLRYDEEDQLVKAEMEL